MPNVGHEASGRPGALLIVWIKCADDFSSQAVHQMIGQKPHCFARSELSFDNRLLAREWVETQPELRQFLEDCSRVLLLQADLLRCLAGCSARELWAMGEYILSCLAFFPPQDELG